MAPDENDTKRRPFYETEVQEGEPVVIRMPVDIRSVALTTHRGAGRASSCCGTREPVLIPIVLGILISYVLGPAVTSMAKHGIPRRSAPSSSSPRSAARSATASTRYRRSGRHHRRCAAGGAEAARPDEAHAGVRQDAACCRRSSRPPTRSTSGRRRHRAGADARQASARPGRAAAVQRVRLRLGRRTRHAQLPRPVRDGAVPRLLPAGHRRSVSNGRS